MTKYTLARLLWLLQVGISLAAYGLVDYDDEAGLTSEERDLRIIRCSAGYDEFYYNTSIEMNIFDSDFPGCSDEELTVFSKQLTDGYDAVIGIDPRLDHVAFLHTEICDAIPEDIDVSDQSQRGLYFVFGYVRNSNYYSQGKFNFVGDGQCKWCPPPSDDRDFRKLLRQPTGNGRDDGMMLPRPSARQLVPSVVSFSLYNTKTKRKMLLLQQHHILDLQVYGDGLDIIAEYNGFSPKTIKFGLDDNPDFSESNVRSMFALGGGKGVDELRDVGTHTITATSYGEDGSVGFPYELSLLIIDGASSGGYDPESTAMPNTREKLISVIEDDTSFYLSELLNDQYYEDPDSCLHGTLVFMKVELSPVSEEEVTCLKEVGDVAVDVAPTELVSESSEGVCPDTRPEVGDHCDAIGNSCEYGIVCCCGFCTIQHVCTCSLNGWRCSTRSYTECPESCPAMCPAELLDMCDPNFWDNQHCPVPGHEQLRCQRECGGRFLESGFDSTCSCNYDTLAWECAENDFFNSCPDLQCPEGQGEGRECGGYQDVQCGPGLICDGVGEDCDPLFGGDACIGRCVSSQQATPSPTASPTRSPVVPPPIDQQSITGGTTDSPTKRPTKSPTPKPTDAPAELREDGCPVAQEILGVQCDEPGLACDYGNQCCCGQCYKKRRCQCNEHGSGYHEFSCSDFNISCDFECTAGACPYYPPQFEFCDPQHFGDRKCPGADKTKLKCQTECGQELVDFGYANTCSCKDDGSWVCEDVTCPPDPCPSGQPAGGPCGGLQQLQCASGMMCANMFGGGLCDISSGSCTGVCTEFDDEGCPTDYQNSSGRACLQQGAQCQYGQVCCCGTCLPAVDCACEGATGSEKLACRKNIFDDCPCDS